MKYPKALDKCGVIGVVAPSAGFTEDKFMVMCDNAKNKLESLGYEIKYSESCFNDINGRSNTSLVRAKEFKEMYLDKNIDILISLSGGEYEMEILDNLDLDVIKNSPVKLFCGWVLCLTVLGTASLSTVTSFEPERKRIVIYLPLEPVSDIKSFPT